MRKHPSAGRPSSRGRDCMPGWSLPFRSASKFPLLPTFCIRFTHGVHHAHITRRPSGVNSDSGAKKSHLAQFNKAWYFGRNCSPLKSPR